MEVGDDARAHHALVVRVRRGHADERFAAARHRRAGEVIQLPAGPADLPETDALRADLPVEVDRDAVVDRDHLVEPADDFGGVHVLQRRHDDAGILVDPLIELFRAEGDPGHALALVVVRGVGELAGLIELVVRVAAQLRVHPEVLQVRVREQLADGVRHAADAELQDRARRDERDDVVRNLFVLRCCVGDRKVRQMIVLPLHDVIDLRDVDRLVEAAVDLGQVLVDFQDDDVRGLEDALRDACRAGEVEVPVLVHGRHAGHRHVHRQEMLVVLHEAAEDHGDEVAQAAVAQLPLIGGAVPAVVHEVLAQRVGLHGVERPEDEVGAELDVEQLVPAPGERLLEQGGEADVRHEVDPVAALYALDRLFRRP